MKRCWLLAAVLLSTAFACSRGMEKPEVFLDEPQMIDVMTDSYLIEAMLGQMKSEGKDIAQFQAEYYSQMFEHYGINDSVFEQNMRYYTERPDVLERIMESVKQRLTQAQSTSSTH